MFQTYGQNPYQNSCDYNLVYSIPPSTNSTCSVISDYKPDDLTQEFVFKVKVHFIQDINGGGNFSATGDGYGGTSYTGYDYASQLINSANYLLANNPPANLPIGNNFAVLPIKIRSTRKKSSSYINFKYLKI